jgi:hypothetical protein
VALALPARAFSSQVQELVLKADHVDGVFFQWQLWPVDRWVNELELIPQLNSRGFRKEPLHSLA